MGRYRAPTPASSPYITADGAAKLSAELEHLWRVRRPQVTQAVAEAAAQGDRSENAEYIYGKRELREIDRRVRYLRKRLATVSVICEPPADRSRIYFGAWFELEHPVGGTDVFHLVGADEALAARHLLSVDSPLGRAVLGKRVDDVVRIDAPAGKLDCRVSRIAYGEEPFGEPEKKSPARGRASHRGKAI
jgi:transcription elongation factor GreB